LRTFLSLCILAQLVCSILTAFTPLAFSIKSDVQAFQISVVQSLITRISENFDKKGLLALANAWEGSCGGNPILVYANEVPNYYIVPITKDNKCIAEMGIDAKTGEWMWYSETYPYATFPPVSEDEAEIAAHDYVQKNSLGDSLAEPQLTMMPDERLYWVFPVLKGDESLSGVCVSFISANVVIPEDEIPKIESTSMNGGGGSTTAMFPYLSDVGCAGTSDPTLNVPYYQQLKSYYCGDAALEMAFNYNGPDVSQYEIADVARTNSAYGTYTDDMLRAAQFSNLSTSVGDDEPAYTCTGYTERAVGYAAFQYAPGSFWLSGLESLIDQGYPIVVLTWYDTTHQSGHFRVVTGYDRSMNEVKVNDPWNGPNVVFSYSTFQDLWSYSGYWGLFIHPWVVSVSVPKTVFQNSIFSVNASITYPCPSLFYSFQYPASSANATITLPTGFSLTLGETPTSTLGTGTVEGGSSTTAHWQVVAGNTSGPYEISVSANGIISGSVGAHGPYSAYSYSDRIGGTSEGNISIIASHPSALISPSLVTMDVGQSQTFNSTVSGGISPYSYQWYLNDSAIGGATGSSYTFAPSPSGHYNFYLNVTDSNSTTVESNSVTVIVNSVPVVSISPPFSAIDVGQSVKFNSTVLGGTSPYAYQWYLNGSAVNGAIGSSYTFVPSARGHYNIYLNVTDSVGVRTLSDTATFVVNSALSASVSPALTTMDVGQSQTFNSTVLGGTSPYTYQWYQNDTAITNATGSSYTFAPSSSGHYNFYLNVTDSANAKARSNSAKATVNSALFVTVSPSSVTLDVGQSQNFTSTASGGTSRFSYQWYLNGSAVSGITSFTWAFGPTSSGFYSIYVNVTDNVNSRAKSNVANVTVNAAPTVSITPGSWTLDVGQSQVFTSSISGGTSPYTYKWYLNGSSVLGATIATWNFTPSSAGTYITYIKVTDSVGMEIMSNNATITVNGALSVVISPASARMSVSKSQLFTAIVSGGTSPYSYQWYLNGTAVSGAVNATWTLTPSTAGNYTVSVKVNDAASSAAVPVTVGQITVVVPEFTTVIPLILTLSLVSAFLLTLTRKRNSPTSLTKALLFFQFFDWMG
jgi:hypothetical protein